MDFELFPSDSHFTDDTVLSVAVAEKLLADKKQITNVRSRKSYAMFYKQYYKRYPRAGFGNMFAEWALSDDLVVQHSFGNGASMRVTPIGYAFDTLQEVISEVHESCYYTHHKKEAMTGAYAVATSVFLAHHNCDKQEIRSYIEKIYHYDLGITLDDIREHYVFDSRTSYSVPPALLAFFESANYEDAIRRAVSIGGDSDTIACMAGGIAEAYYKEIPKSLLLKGKGYLDIGLKSVIQEFYETYIKR